MPKSLLIIGDAHSHPDFANDRFDWLGKLILEQKPDIIVDMGDWADMPSLSHYDFGKACYEGRRYQKDIECAIDARRRVMAPTNEYNEKQAQAKHAQYKPRWISLGGNHEEGRINKALEADPKLIGLMSHWDLGYEELGWEYYPFQQIVDIEGIAFTHYFMGGVMGKGVGGKYPAAGILSKYHTSCVQGHTHYFQMHHEQGRNGKLYSFIAGCYFDYDPLWTKAHIFYDRGILMLHGVKNGSLESFSWIGLEDIKRRFA
jgi:hypothetical protein